MDPYISLVDLARAYRAGTTTPSRVTRALLDRIERLEPRIGAFQAVYADEAMRAADAATHAIASGHAIGPFHGIPFGLKDICDLEGRITTGGSKAMADRVSPVTGTVTARLIAAGGIVLGKTKTVECAYGGWGTNQHMGTPWNPWDIGTHRAPGGSSAGSGAAVAAGMAICAVGTDTGGSVRLPSAFCGLTGLKTTEGQLPTDGILPLSHTLDTPGPMARSVEDAAVMYQVMAGAEAHEISHGLAARTGIFASIDRGAQGLVLGILTEQERLACSADVLAAYDKALDELSGLGAVLKPFVPPTPFAETTVEIGRIMSAEAYYHHGALYDDPEAPMDEDVRPRMLAGKSISAAEYLGLLASRRQAMEDFSVAMRGFDAVLTPSMTSTAPSVADLDQSVSPAHFTRTFNYLAMCALALPTGPAADGLPTSLQIAARGGDEAMVLRIGAALERVQPAPNWPRL